MTVWSNTGDKLIPTFYRVIIVTSNNTNYPDTGTDGGAISPNTPAELIAAETVPVAVSETIPEEAPAPETKRSEDVLERSRQALASGDTQVAVELYGDLVKRKKSLESVIEDLRIAVDRTPDNPDLWQVLGDAYMRDDQTDEAINAYRKGMETA